MNDHNAMEWMKYARQDLDTARLTFEHGLYVPAVFHGQQAAEKALKAIIVSQGRNPPRTHDCLALLDQLLDDLPAIETLSSSLDRLAPYAVEIRYPGGEDVEAEEARQALFDAEHVVRFAKSVLIPE